MEQENVLKKGFGAVSSGTKGHRGTIGASTASLGGENGEKQRSQTIKGKEEAGFGGSGLENVLDLDGGATQEDIIASVEMMLQSE